MILFGCLRLHNVYILISIYMFVPEEVDNQRMIGTIYLMSEYKSCFSILLGLSVNKLLQKYKKV